jgi:serine/threonine protein kinase
MKFIETLIRKTVFFSPSAPFDALVLYSSEDQRWKIADFGLTSCGTHVPISTRRARGTPCYSAYELLHSPGSVFSKETDIWSLGCILYELLTGQRLFKSDEFVYRYAFTREPPEISLHGVYEPAIFQITQLILSTINLDQGRPSVENLIVQTAALKGNLEIDSEEGDPPSYDDVFPSDFMNIPITGTREASSVSSTHGSEITQVAQTSPGNFGSNSSWQSHW